MAYLCLLLAAQEQPSQSTAAETSQEADDIPPIQNTLGSQPEAEAVPSSAPAPAPAGPASSTPQLPQQSLVEKLNEAAEEEPVLTKAVGAEDASIAFVTEPGMAEGIQTSADAAAATAGTAGILSPACTAPAADKAGTQSSAGKTASAGKVASSRADDAGDVSVAEQPADQPPAKSRTSRAAKAAATANIANTAMLESGGKRDRPSAEKKMTSGAKASFSNSTDKENSKSAPAEEASHMAEKNPHSRVAEVKGLSPGQITTSKKKKAGSDSRDPLIGRHIKKDFETDTGLKTYTGWVIGKHEAKGW